MMYLTPGGVSDAGPGSDTTHIDDPCHGGTVIGGPGKDGTVFAGSDYGVKASLKSGYAKWVAHPCPSPITLKDDLEGLEGSRHNDILIASGNGKTSLLGRDGSDVFYAKNGVKDVVTTGGGGRSNKVYADKADKVIWGWGLAAY